MRLSHTAAVGDCEGVELPHTGEMSVPEHGDWLAKRLEFGVGRDSPGRGGAGVNQGKRSLDMNSMKFTEPSDSFLSEFVAHPACHLGDLVEDVA